MVRGHSTRPESPADASLQYLYAIVQGLPRRWRPPATGVGGGAVVARPIGGLVVVAGAVTTLPPRTPRTLALHHDVVATTLPADAVLPLPYGTVMRSREIDAWLSAHRGRVLRSLARLRGCLEMTVRLVRLDAAPISEVGRMPARRESVVHRGKPRADAGLDTLASEVIDRAGLAEWRYEPGTGDSAASVAFLVPSADLAQFLTRIAPVASRAVGVAVVPTGPRAPYSFVPALDESERPLPAVSCAG